MVGTVFHTATQKAVFLSVCNIQGIVSSSQFTSFNVKCKCADAHISQKIAWIVGHIFLWE